MLPEDMNDYIAVVHQHPAEVRSAFDAPHGDVLLAQLLVDVALDRPLPLVVRRTDNEIVGDGCQVADAKHDDIGSLGVRGNVRDCSGEGVGVDANDLSQQWRRRGDAGRSDGISRRCAESSEGFSK